MIWVICLVELSVHGHQMCPALIKAFKDENIATEEYLKLTKAANSRQVYLMQAVQLVEKEV